MLYFVFSPSCCCCLVFRPPEPVSLSTDGEGIGWRVIILGIGGLPWRQEASLGAGPTFNASSLGCRLVSLSVGVRGKQIIQDGFTLAGQYFKSWGKKQHISDKFTSFFSSQYRHISDPVHKSSSSQVHHHDLLSNGRERDEHE